MVTSDGKEPGKVAAEGKSMAMQLAEFWAYMLHVN